MVFYKILAVHEYLGTFWPLKAKKWGKMGKNRCARSVTNHVWLILIKSVLNEKGVFPQMIKVGQKKFSYFLRKNWFLAVFVILEKSQKWPKIIFFFWKVEIFLTHLNHLGKQYFFIFYTFWFNQKKIKKDTFFHFFLAKNCPSFNVEGQKVLKIKIFMESLQNRNCHIWPK